MSKRKRKAGRAGESPALSNERRRWARAAVMVPLALCLVAAAAASLRWEPVRHAVGLAPAMEPAAQATPTPLQLSKEYVYAGGRLVATEEPTPTFAGLPPANLVATASTITPPSASVSVSWVAPASGTVTSYIVERASLVGQFAPVGQPLSAPTTSSSDSSAFESSAYLYRLNAVFSGRRA